MKPPKIRRVWTRHPAERIKEDEERKDYCSLCGLFETDPEACLYCVRDEEDEQIGGA